jgi:hypothetical protein
MLMVGLPTVVLMVVPPLFDELEPIFVLVTVFPVFVVFIVPPLVIPIVFVFESVDKEPVAGRTLRVLALPPNGVVGTFMRGLVAGIALFVLALPPNGVVGTFMRGPVAGITPVSVFDMSDFVFQRSGGCKAFVSTGLSTFVSTHGIVPQSKCGIIEV